MHTAAASCRRSKACEILIHTYNVRTYISSVDYICMDLHCLYIMLLTTVDGCNFGSVELRKRPQ